jgi:hypothetical protein
MPLYIFSFVLLSANRFNVAIRTIRSSNLI